MIRRPRHQRCGSKVPGKVSGASLINACPFELRAKALQPAYREISSVSANGRVTHNFDAGVLDDAVAKVAGQLDESFRPLLPAPARVIKPTRVNENEPR